MFVIKIKSDIVNELYLRRIGTKYLLYDPSINGAAKYANKFDAIRAQFRILARFNVETEIKTI